MAYRMTDEAKYCKDCEKCRFCRTWGEYKCIEKMQRLKSGETLACDKFKKRKGEILDCKCDDCLSRAGNEE